MKRILTKDDAESAVNDLALAANNKRKLTARADAEKLAVDDKYAGSIAACDATVAQIEAALKTWAEANPDEFAKKKSIKFASGTLGWRDGNLKLVLAGKTWSWPRALQAVMERLPNFIRSAPELDKEALIAQREELADVLPKCGLKVEQGERFYVKPNLTETETK